MAYTELLNVLGRSFTSDIRGRQMYMESKETRYSSTGNIGISKFYPMFAGEQI